MYLTAEIPQELIWQISTASLRINLSENVIHPFAVGRKNWLFNSCIDGANANAVIYTMIGKAHNLNIYGYLKFFYSVDQVKI